jgi:hypothetical protein
MVKVLCVLNHKGGVGKTTTTANVADGLNFLKKKVLMIDLDPQANLTTHFGLSQSENEITIYDALMGKAKLPIRNVPDTKGLDIVCSSTDDMTDIEIQLSGAIGREFKLRELIKPVIDRYDRRKSKPLEGDLKDVNEVEDVELSNAESEKCACRLPYQIHEEIDMKDVFTQGSVMYMDRNKGKLQKKHRLRRK